jgi:hypothetical protein
MTSKLWSRKKGPNWNSQNHGLRRSINPHAGRCSMCVFPNPKSCDRQALPTQGTSTCHRRDRLFRICRHCQAQVGEALRHFKIARYVALTKLASTDRSEPIAAATWAPAFSGSNSCPRLQVEGLDKVKNCEGHWQAPRLHVRFGPKADMSLSFDNLIHTAGFIRPLRLRGPAMLVTR